MPCHILWDTKPFIGLDGYDRINQWHTEQFGYFLDKLKSLEDGEGTVFDNSIVLYGSGIKHEDYHSVTTCRWCSTAGAAGRSRRVGLLNIRTHRTAICLKIMEMMGVQREQYGNHRRIPGKRNGRVGPEIR